MSSQSDARSDAGSDVSFDPQVACARLRADSPCVDALYPSANIQLRAEQIRPDLLLMHYTGFADVNKAIDWLARPESRVSCHYVVACDGGVTQMVAEDLRAWHAGESCWDGVRDINSRSIGIEIQNPGHDLGYPDFPDAQMEAVIALSRDIVARHAIRPDRVLAHSDIAPHRKIDPGEKFDWARLSRSQVGHWVPPVPVEGLGCAGDSLIATGDIAYIQTLLGRYGYDCPVTGEIDKRTGLVVAAFQRHFRPAKVDGRIDRSSIATLEALLDARPAGPAA